MNKVINDLKRAMVVFKLDTTDTLGLLSIPKAPVAYKMYCVLKNYDSHMSYNSFAQAMRKYSHVPDEYDLLRARMTFPRRQGKSKLQALSMSNLCQEITLEEKPMSKPTAGYIVINTTNLFKPEDFFEQSVSIPSTKHPTIIHKDIITAEAEAERLAEQNPAQTFMVFGTKSAFVTEKPVVRHVY